MVPKIMISEPPSNPRFVRKRTLSLSSKDDELALALDNNPSRSPRASLCDNIENKVSFPGSKISLLKPHSINHFTKSPARSPGNIYLYLIFELYRVAKKKKFLS